MFSKKNVAKAVAGLQKVVDDLSQVAVENEKAKAEAIKAKIQELLS